MWICRRRVTIWRVRMCGSDASTRHKRLSRARSRLMRSSQNSPRVIRSWRCSATSVYFPRRYIMGIPAKLIEFLNQNKVPYQILHHPEAFTAQELAAIEHVKGKQHAKVVMVKTNGTPMMAVL